MHGRLSATVVSTLFLAVLACGGTTTPSATVDASIIDDAAVDASLAPETSPPDPLDGTPTTTSACTPLSKQVGNIVNTQHGRLDGTLAFVVPKGGAPSCNGDDTHVHLQVRANGAIYDVAVDIGSFNGDVFFYETDMAIPDGPWAEGWHGTDALSYTQLGLHSPQFSSQDPIALGKKIEAELAGINHISVFGTGYAQKNGCHLVHYVGGALDGAIVTHPLSGVSHVMFFRFSTQGF
jgi:hypothetical protein